MSTQPFPTTSLSGSSSSLAMPVSRREPTMSTASMPSGSSATAAPVSTASILRSAGGDYAKALEQAIDDRNALAGQNSQLWKMLEKQRSGYSSLLKELDRIRGERDSWKARAKGAIRHNSSDATHATASNEPVQPQRKSSLPPLVLPHRSASLSAHPEEAPESVSPHSDVPASSIPVTVPAGYNSAIGGTMQGASHSSHASTSTITQANSATLAPPESSLSRDSHISLPPEVRQYIATMPDSPNPQTASTENTSDGQTQPVSSSSNDQSDSDGFLDMSQDNDDSTSSMGRGSPDKSDSDEDGPDPQLSASLHPRHPHQDPQQARPDDFPLPPGSQGQGSTSSSPPTSALPPQQAQLVAAQQAQAALVQQQRQEALLAQQRDQEHREAQIVAQREQAIAREQQLHRQWEQQQQQLTQSQAHSDLEAQKRAVREAQAELEKVRARQEALDVERQRRGMAPYSPSGSASGAPSPPASMPLLPTRPPNAGPLTPSEMHPHRIPHSATLTETPVPATFRSLPLLPSDLPHTRILVSHSFVRPNDRGKEVLSFVIQVDPCGTLPPHTPGSRKEPWKVQKLFSDVLGLDHRIRSSLARNKSVLKKMANLPEGKLWNLKDAAPVRVDQRKQVLQVYLQSLVDLPIKSNDEVVAFFTSDIVRGGGEAVTREGHKEGYLTKRGKNFGGWKTRYFVLDGPALEYYESRGGAHLGSIQITGAQIGRQQRIDSSADGNDEKEYRHAFLIVESKKGQGGSNARHVLCAESDQERDAWVDILVRYFTGTYNDDPSISYNGGTRDTTSPMASSPSPHPPTAASPSPNGRTSSSSSRPIVVQKGNAVPISSLPPESANPKLFDYAAHAQQQQQAAGQLPSSLPSDASPLSVAVAAGERSNSELGHYADMDNNRRHRGTSPEKLRRPPPQQQQHHHPQHSNASPVGGDQRPDTPEHSKKIISGPMNGQPIPAGYKFGDREDKESGGIGGGIGGGSSTSLAASSASNHTKGGSSSDKGENSKSADRREKAKSRGFWSFGRQQQGASEKPVMPIMSRPVFGVTLEESLEVSQIASLPSIVFRCIQYLEAKKADQEEGIYRLSGSSAEIKTLKDRFNAEGDVDLLGSDQFWDPHAIAGLLKGFLRELPASILTRDLHLKFLSVIDFVDPQERIRELSQLIAALPTANYSLLRALTAHLILIVKHAPVNKMTMRNVGIVFSPTLGIPAGVFSLMLGEFNRVFNVNDGEEEGDDSEAKEGEQVEGEHETSSSSKLSVRTPRTSTDAVDRRNSRHYQDAAADQLLGLTGRGQLSAPDEDDDEDEAISVAGTETTTATSTTDESYDSRSPGSTSGGGGHSNGKSLSAPDTPTGRKTRTGGGSAGPGLTVQVSSRGNRHSRMMGLPTSPRPNQTTHQHHQQSPQHHGQQATPTTITGLSIDHGD